MSKPISTILIFFLLTSCNPGTGEGKTGEGQTATPQYYYFPKANVYIDSANKDYIFLANDGKTWQSAKQIPAAMQAMMDKNVLIENPSQPVWEDNENHRLVYSALLYATANDTTRKETPRPISTQPKPSKDTVAEAEKERKGLRKFFDKIFKKKNKHKVEEEQNQ